MIYGTAIVAGLFLLLFLLERVIPLRQPKHWLVGRLAVNICVTGLAFVANATLVQPTASFMQQWTNQQSFGFVHLLALPAAIKVAIAFLLMDLTFYYWHRANHRIPFLWRFHNAHHIDLDLDVSTGFRFHFVEIVLSAGFRFLQVALIGVSAGTYLIYEFVYQANTLFHHSNVRLPIWMERVLNVFLVTPRMHGIHHSHIQEETNSNYCVVFPWWDRLHKTLRLNVPQAEIDIGVPAYSETEDNKLKNVLIKPFQKQRKYGCGANKIIAQRNPDVLEKKTNRLAE